MRVGLGDQAMNADAMGNSDSGVGIETRLESHAAPVRLTAALVQQYIHRNRPIVIYGMVEARDRGKVGFRAAQEPTILTDDIGAAITGHFEEFIADEFYWPVKPSGVDDHEGVLGTMVYVIFVPFQVYHAHFGPPVVWRSWLAVPRAPSSFPAR